MRIASECRDTNHYRCDVTDPSDWRSLWQKTEESLGQISLLVNNAGVNSKVSGSRTAIDVMLMGAAEGLYLAFEKMSRKNVHSLFRRAVSPLIQQGCSALSGWPGRSHHQRGFLGRCHGRTGRLRAHRLPRGKVRNRGPHEEHDNIGDQGTMKNGYSDTIWSK